MSAALLVNCSPVTTGATQEICRLLGEELSSRCTVRTVSIADYPMACCTGCRSCHATGRCVLPPDGAPRLLAELDRARTLVFVSPSYWADVPGQFKVFIDRCTPWSNTHTPHAALTPGKGAYAVALRTGPGEAECQRILTTLTHFLGHLDVPCLGTLALTGVESRADLPAREAEIRAFARSFEIQGSDPHALL